MKKRIIKMSLAMGLALFLVFFVGNEIFLSKSPVLRDDYLTRIVHLPNKIKDTIYGFFYRNTTVKRIETSVQDKPVNKIAAGVYGQTSTEGAVTRLDFGQMQTEAVFVDTKKGNRIMLIVPRGQHPSQSVIDDIKTRF